MHKPFLLLLLALSGLAPVSNGQLLFSHKQDITVEIGGKELALPWAGGLNGVSANTIDLNGDGTEELVIFDRSAQKISTFSWLAGWQYAPQFEALLPKIESWLLLYDYNCDGNKDLFTSTASGLLAYQNISLPNQTVLFAEPVLVQTTSFSGAPIPLKVDVTNLPAIADLDHDGDPDILTAVPSFGGSFEWHKNLSVESTGNCGELLFEKATNQWGNIRECGDCLTYLFDENETCNSGRVTHSGSAILAIDLEGDADYDLLLSEVLCANLTSFMNNGTAETPLFDASNAGFPESFPVQLPLFPAPYFTDLNADGKRDLLVSPNLSGNEGIADFRHSVHVYQNTQTDAAPVFSFQQPDFLQAEMIDLGENAFPATVDLDFDGDLDLLISSAGYFEDGEFASRIWLFENTGRNQAPKFVLKTTNFMDWGNQQATDLMPQFIDVNADNLPDLVVNYRSKGSNQQKLQWIKGKVTTNQTLSYSLADTVSFSINLRPTDVPLLLHANADQQADLLIARWQGNLELWEGTSQGFVLANASFGGIARDFFHQFPAITLANVDADAQPDLVWADWSGELVVYRNFLDLPSTWQKTPLHLGENLEESRASYLGSRAFPAAFGTHILVGTRGGGLHFLENKEQLVTATDQPFLAKVVEVFPNPATDRLRFRSEKALFLLLTDLTGKSLKSIALEGKGEVEVSVTELPAGMYIVVPVGGQVGGAIKIMIQR